MKKKLIIKFPHKHPLFKKKETNKGVYYENSIYYFWFEFLKRNKKFIEICKSKGSLNKYFYEDFRDIRQKSFKQWWNEKYKGTIRGIYLFAYQNPFTDIEEIVSINEINSINLNEFTILAIPKNIEKNYALKKVRGLINKDNKRFINKARYEFKSKTFKVKSLRNYLEFLRLKDKGYKNWQAIALIFNKKIENIESSYKISFNQIANKWSRAIKKINDNFLIKS
jgi:hypothetical protein